MIQVDGSASCTWLAALFTEAQLFHFIFYKMCFDELLCTPYCYSIYYIISLCTKMGSLFYILFIFIGYHQRLSQRVCFWVNYSRQFTWDYNFWSNYIPEDIMLSHQHTCRSVVPMQPAQETCHLVVLFSSTLYSLTPRALMSTIVPTVPVNWFSKWKMSLKRDKTVWHEFRG